MKQNQILNLLIVSFAVIFFCSCSLVQWSGRVTRRVGESMTEYSEENDGFIGKMSGLGGSVYTAAGRSVENIGNKEDSGKSKTEQVKGAISESVDTTIEAVEDYSVSKDVVLQAQSRLKSLGYNPGPIDGIMGKKTRRAIGMYQQSQKLEKTNSLDKKTLSALDLSSTE